MKQNFKNHSKYVIGYHVVLLLLTVAGIIGSVINVYHSIGTTNLFNASLLMVLFLIAAILFWYVRQFPLKAQDRAIKAEENLRYYALTGKLLPNTLRTRQIIALRFASDEEYVELVDRVLFDKLSSTEIKQAIIAWRADHNRL